MAGMGGVLFGPPLRMAPSALFCPTLHWVACQVRPNKSGKADQKAQGCEMLTETCVVCAVSEGWADRWADR
jgi:hypothetical protein